MKDNLANLVAFGFTVVLALPAAATDVQSPVTVDGKKAIGLEYGMYGTFFDWGRDGDWNLIQQGVSIGHQVTATPPPGGLLVRGPTGIGTANPRATLHVRKNDTGAFLDTSHDTLIIEGDEGRLQLASDDSGNSGASLVLSNNFSNSETRNWLIDHMTSSKSNRLSFRYGTQNADGDTFSGTSEVLSLDANSYGSTLNLRGVSTPGSGRCQHTAVEVTPLELDPDVDCDGHETILFKAEDVNHFIWSPYNVGENEFGMFWATNDNASWQSGDVPSNPNEIVFVGYGERRASISLRDGDAHFNQVKASEIIVEANYWADHVFQEDYNLRPLSVVERYIETNGHLPGVASAKDVMRNGINIGENQAQLLQKIEELTLYVIAQAKQIKEQGNEISNLRKIVSDN
jgi:hypothetical protein